MNYLFKLFLLFSLLITSALARETLKIGCIKGGIGSDIFFEILSEACHNLNIHCERLDWPSERTLKMTEWSTIDGDGPRNVIVEKYYPKLVRVEFNFFNVEFVGFSKIPGIGLKKWEDLEQVYFSYLRGWKIFDAHTPKAKRRVFNSSDNMMKDIAEPTTRYPTRVFLTTVWDGFDLLKKHKLEGKFMLEPGVLSSKAQYFYLSPKNRHLAPKFVATLYEMKKSGRILAIIQNALNERLGFIPRIQL